MNAALNVSRQPDGAAQKAVLLVDDDPLLCQLLEHKLAARGHAVRVAHDGESALASVHAAPPDLIVLDAMIPVRDGFDVLRQLKANSGTMQIPVVMLTAFAGETDVVRALQMGAADYLVKPFRLEELMVRMHRLICPDGGP